MISLTEYIKGMTFEESMHDIGYLKSRVVEEAFMFYQDYGIPQHIYQAIVNDEFPDIVEENLKSHDWKSLVNKIKRDFGEYIKTVYEVGQCKDNLKAFGLEMNDISKKNMLLDDPKFKQLLEFYNYYFSQVAKFDKNVLIFEPRYSSKRNELLNGVYYAYHVTNKKNLNSIMSHGLHPRKPIDKDLYREYPECIYIYIPKFKDKNSDIVIGIYELMRMKGYSKDNIAVLKIDLRRFNENIYNDTAMENERCVFTYGDIFTQMIQDVTDKFTKYL